MDPKTNGTNRRTVLVRGLELAGILLVTLAFGVSKSATAKAAKSDLQYQDHRRDGKGCADCKYFASSVGSSDAGSCELVDGAISPDGWCAAYSPRVKVASWRQWR